MNRSTRESKTICPRIDLLGLLVLVAVPTWADQGSPASGVKLEVASVRVLSNKEASDRSPDFVGPDVVVRLRLSCSNRGLFFYTWKDSIVPVGYKVKWTDGGVVWMYGKPGQQEHRSSPGIEKLDALVPGSWRLMSGHYHATIEWEEMDSTSYAGQKHAFTLFVRLNEKDEPKEIISEPFVVPTKPPEDR